MDESFADTLEKDEMPEDVQKKLSSIFEKYNKLSDEEKEQFHKGAYDVLTKSFNELNNDSILPIWLVPYQSYILFIFALSVVAFLLVIVAHKLYKGLKERENRKEAKRRLKQQKAKKKKN